MVRLRGVGNLASKHATKKKTITYMCKPIKSDLQNHFRQLIIQKWQNEWNNIF